MLSLGADGVGSICIASAKVWVGSLVLSDAALVVWVFWDAVIVVWFLWDAALVVWVLWDAAFVVWVL